MAIRRGQWGRHRLSGQKNFARVFGGRHSAGSPALVVYALPNELELTRMGLSVGRKCGNAVTRNLIKRRLREAFRAVYDDLPRGFDFICIPRPGKSPTLDECRALLTSVCVRAVRRYQTSRRSK